jgi:GT2 family glycosyltransferase
MMDSPAGIELTVIIPTYNRSSVVMRCLGALLRQTLPTDTFEVIVSDDGSTDDTRERTGEVSKAVSLHIGYLWQSNKGANGARNRAIEAARGRILLFINDDTIASTDMLEQHLRSHSQYPEEQCAVLGLVTVSPEVPHSLFSNLHLDASYRLWQGKRELDWRAFYTCNVSVKRSFLLKHGLFEEQIRYHEDIELAARLSRFGLKVMFNPEAVGYHYHLLTEEEYLKMARKDGEALAAWYRKSPHQAYELSLAGLHLTAPLLKKVKYFIGDLAVNAATIPLLLKAARYFARSHQTVSLLLYTKIYQSLKRSTVRKEMRR